MTVRTNKNRHAGTQAQVTLTVYGHKGNSGPLPLGNGDGEHFQSGAEDKFDVSNLCFCLQVKTGVQCSSCSSHFVHPSVTLRGTFFV